jgi:pilus assembly protein Flp/PilA
MTSRIRRSERGASAVEYALLIAGIAAVIVFATVALGGVTISMFSNTCSTLDSAAAASADC